MGASWQRLMGCSHDYHRDTQLCRRPVHHLAAPADGQSGLCAVPGLPCRQIAGQEFQPARHRLLRVDSEKRAAELVMTRGVDQEAQVADTQDSIQDLKTAAEKVAIIRDAAQTVMIEEIAEDPAPLMGITAEMSIDQTTSNPTEKAKIRQEYWKSTLLA